MKKELLILANSEPVAFDVDETLLIFNYPKELEDLAIEFDNGVKAVPHYKHIKQMAEHYARGHQIVVWSAGGWQWAEEAVERLGLAVYDPLVMKKFVWFYDDKAATEFLPDLNRVYYPIESIREAYEEFIRK